MKSVGAEAIAQAKTILKKFKQCKVPMKMNGKIIKVGFRREGNKHLIADLHERNLPIGVNDLKHLPQMMENAEYKTSADNANGKTHMGLKNISRFHYFRASVRGKVFFLNVAEITRNQGNIKLSECFLYSITSKIKN